MQKPFQEQADAVEYGPAVAAALQEYWNGTQLVCVSAFELFLWFCSQNLDKATSSNECLVSGCSSPGQQVASLCSL